MAETYSQIRTWIDGIFKLNGKKFITGEHANQGYKKVLAKSEELYNSQGQPSGIATLGADGLLAESQRPASDSSYKGYHTTPTALRTSFPVGQAGWFCTVGSTDTMWAWDVETNDWVDTNKQSAGMATQIYEAATKATPADADLLGYVDTENNNVLKKFTWANLKSVLKTYFDTLYQTILLTTKGDFLSHNGTTRVRVPIGTDGQIPTADSANANGWAWKTPSTGSAGHTIQNNSVALTTRTNLNFMAANGESIATDDSANNQSDIAPKIRAMNDYNATGEVAGSVIARNSSNNGFETILTSYFDIEMLIPVANVSANGDIGIDVPAGYKFVLIAKNETANAITNFKVTDGTNDLVTAANVVANGFTVFSMDTTKMNLTNDLNIYASADTWNSSNLTLYFRFERII